MIAKHMETLPAEDRFSVIVEQGSGFDELAVKFFWWLANNETFEYRHRLMTCTPARPTDVVGLQTADMMAYEYFRQLHSPVGEMRVPMKRIRATTNYAEGFFGAATLKRLKNEIELAECGDGQLVVIPSL